MPMPKLMIDLASPSTGGSTDVVAGTTRHQNNSAQTTKEIFKNNLVRAAKNSSAIN